MCKVPPVVSPFSFALKKFALIIYTMTHLAHNFKDLNFRRPIISGTPSLGLALQVTRGVSRCGLVIYIKKYLKAKEELRKLKYFTMQKYIIFKKKSSKRNQKNFETL